MKTLTEKVMAKSELDILHEQLYAAELAENWTESHRIREQIGVIITGWLPRLLRDEPTPIDRGKR